MAVIIFISDDFHSKYQVLMSEIESISVLNVERKFSVSDGNRKNPDFNFWQK